MRTIAGRGGAGARRPLRKAKRPPANFGRVLPSETYRALTHKRASGMKLLLRESGHTARGCYQFLAFVDRVQRYAQAAEFNGDARSVKSDLSQCTNVLFEKGVSRACRIGFLGPRLKLRRQILTSRNTRSSLLAGSMSDYTRTHLTSPFLLLYLFARCRLFEFILMRHTTIHRTVRPEPGRGHRGRRIYAGRSDSVRDRSGTAQRLVVERRSVQPPPSRQ